MPDTPSRPQGTTMLPNSMLCLHPPSSWLPCWPQEAPHCRLAVRQPAPPRSAAAAAKPPAPVQPAGGVAPADAAGAAVDAHLPPGPLLCCPVDWPSCWGCSAWSQRTPPTPLWTWGLDSHLSCCPPPWPSQQRLLGLGQTSWLRPGGLPHDVLPPAGPDAPCPSQGRQPPPLQLQAWLGRVSPTTTLCDLGPFCSCILDNAA